MNQIASCDPAGIIESLRDHLTEGGGIQEKSIPELMNLMSGCGGKLVPRCLALYIITASELPVKSILCGTIVWDIMFKWLQEALQEDNFTFLQELMKVYYDLPVTVDQLTKNVCPKLINTLSKKCGNDVVRKIASDIVKKWKEVINLSARKDGGEVSAKKRKVESLQESAPAESPSPVSKVAKKRRTTVKVPPTVMRTAGLEDMIPPPKPKVEVQPKKSKPEVEKVESAAPIESFHQKITVTPTEPKKLLPEIHESCNFINALTNSQPVVRKKRKIVRVDGGSNSGVSVPEIDFPLSDLPYVDNQNEKSSLDCESKKSNIAGFSIPINDKKPKKRVNWASGDDFLQVHLFEIVPNERINVSRVPYDGDKEGQWIKHQPDNMPEWFPPPPLELTPAVEAGCKSVERQIQAERERRVLQVIFIPGSVQTPEEPDKEEFKVERAVEIPLDDLHHKDLLIVNDKGDGHSQMSLNPEVANLVKSIALNLTQDDSTNRTAATEPSPPANVGLSGLHPSSPPTSSDNYRRPPSNHFQGHPLPPGYGGNFDHPHPPHPHGPGRVPPPLQYGERGPPPPHFLNGGMRPPHPRGPPLRPPHMGGPPPYRHPPYGPDGPTRFTRGPMHPHPPAFRGHPPPPPMYPPGGRPPMNSGPRGPRSEQLCKFFQQGHCRNGKECPFLHTTGYQPAPNW